MDPSGAPLPTLRCPRIAHNIRVDGDLHKAPWRSLAPVWLQPADGRGAAIDVERALRQLKEDARPPVDEIGFQPTALRVHCVDRDVWGSLRGRNQPIYTEEVVEAFLAPDGDVRRYVELEASPQGAWFEARVESPERRRATMRVDLDWSCAGWERAVRVRGAAKRSPGSGPPDCWWSAEWAIPFAALPGAMPPRPGARWRANFFRIDAAGGGQFSAWSPTFAVPADFHVPDRFGILEFA